MENKFKTIILSTINILTSFLIIAVAFTTRTLIDKAVEDKPVKIYIILLIIFTLIELSLRAIYQVLKNQMYLSIELNLKKELFSSLLDNEIPDSLKYHTGELSNIYLVDIKNIASGKTDTIPDIFANGSKAIFSFIALAIFDYKFLALLVAAGMLLYIVAKLFYRSIKNLQKESLELDGQINSFMQESIENIRVIKALDATENAKIKLLQKVEKTKKTKTKKNHRIEVAENGLSISMNISYLIAILYAIYKMMNKTMTYGDLYIFAQLVILFETPLMSFAGYINKINIYRTSEVRVKEILSLPKEDTTQVIPDFDEIVFDDVSFSYDKEVISHFSQSIKKNELILFKGPSGVGKTTLFYLLLGFLKPTSGHIYIKYKEDTYEVSAKTRGLFSYVGQSNILFSGSLFENIKFFNPNVTNEKILEVLELVNLRTELENREETIDIKLKEHGVGLSIGQIQRVLIAISLLQEKPIMLLDEFSSALDEENERSIVELLLKLNKTIIFISHRNIESNEIRRINL